jgi:hypothetical protein
VYSVRRTIEVVPTWTWLSGSERFRRASSLSRLSASSILVRHWAPISMDGRKSTRSEMGRLWHALKVPSKSRIWRVRGSVFATPFLVRCVPLRPRSELPKVRALRRNPMSQTVGTVPTPVTWLRRQNEASFYYKRRLKKNKENGTSRESSALKYPPWPESSNAPNACA